MVKYLPSDIVRTMKYAGYDLFTLNKHADLWKALNAKDPAKPHGTLIAKTWFWYETWLAMAGPERKARRKKISVWL